MSGNVALYACAAPPGRLRVWLGLRVRTAAPALAWTLNGQPTAPEALRPLASVRTGDLVSGEEPRVFTGLYDFSVLPGASGPFQVGVSLDGGAPVTASLKVLPHAVPTGLERSFNVLISSCFYWKEDKEGLAGTVLDSIRREWNPDLLLLVGDQVYLDQPPLASIPTDPAPMARRFENLYAYNWFEDVGLAKGLRGAPFACVPDDHDYWNNYPHAALHIRATWSKKDRDTWGRVARTLYGHFQHVEPSPPGTPLVLDVDPLSFCILDTRANRQENYSAVLSPEAMKRVVRWAEACVAGRKLAVLVTGQSMLMGKAGSFNRRWGDSTRPNYGDYKPLVEQLERLMRQAGDVLLVTGDFHWGRTAQLTPQDVLAGAQELYEVVSSPTSLLSDSVLDDIGGVGKPPKRDPDWPRHSEADILAGIFEFEGTHRRHVAITTHRQTGNQVCMLSFRRSGSGVEVTPRYFPLKPGLPPRVARTFTLRRR